MIFGGLVVILTILALVILVLPILKKPVEKDMVARDQQNIQIAKEKKTVLVKQLEDGEMSQDEYEEALKDLETSLALDLQRQQTLQSNSEGGQWAVWLIAILVPAISVVMYAKIGEYRVIENPELAKPQTQTAQSSPHGQGENPSIEEMIQQLKDHLKQNPEDDRGWFMLGRTMMAMNDYDEAVTAYQRSYDLKQNDPTIMLALADSLAMTRNRVMAGEPEQLVMKVLQMQPDNATALWLAGMAAEQDQRYREAYDHWTRLLPQLANDPNMTAEVTGMLERLRSQDSGLPALAEAPVASGGLSVQVSLDASLQDQVSPNDLVFIYAKAASGPPMPLAARRMKVSDLPVEVSLSDNDAMMPQMTMSGFDQIVVGARVSRSGNPIAQSGDLFDESEAISHKSFEGTVQVNIDQVKP